MKTEDRDARLGEALDRAVHGLDPSFEGRLPEIRRRGARRRAERWTAIGVALAVFVGGIGWAGFELGQHKRGREGPLPSATVAYHDPHGQWSFRYPSNWHARTFGINCGHVDIEGVYVSNHALPPPVTVVTRRNGKVTGVSCTGFPRLHSAPRDTVVVEVQDLVGGPARPEGQGHVTYPLSLAKAHPFTGHPRAGFTVVGRQLPIVALTEHVSVVGLLGDQASSSDRGRVDRVVASIRFRQSSSAPRQAASCPRPRPSRSSGASPRTVAPGQPLWTTFCVYRQGRIAATRFRGGPLDRGLNSSVTKLPNNLVCPQVFSVRLDTVVVLTYPTTTRHVVIDMGGCRPQIVFRDGSKRYLTGPATKTVLHVYEATARRLTEPSPNSNETRSFRDGYDGWSLTYPASWHRTAFFDRCTPPDGGLWCRITRSRAQEEQALQVTRQGLKSTPAR